MSSLLPGTLPTPYRAIQSHARKYDAINVWHLIRHQVDYLPDGYLTECAVLIRASRARLQTALPTLVAETCKHCRRTADGRQARAT